jgi:tetratricopeptide (TPR) repeat protein
MLLLNRALVAANEKNFDLSLQFLDTVTELYPDWSEGFNRRAYLYVVKLDYGRALGDLRRVLALDPNNFRALEGLVQVLRTMGQDKAALDVVRTLVKAHPFSPGAQETLKQLEEAVDGRGI